MTPIYKPYINPRVTKYAFDAISTGWIANGDYKNIAENKLKEYLGVNYVILLNSGTAALHLMARALYKFKPEITKIIVPNNVYVAAWNGFIYDNKYTLIPVEPDVNTWCMDTNKIGSIDINNTAILAVHNVSSVINVSKLKRDYPGITILEDACEGFSGKYEGHLAGTEGLMSAFSFFSNKTITSGEGGAFVTNDKDIYDYCYKLHGQGQSDVRYVHDEIGYNYRMTNVQAALLYGQLLELDIILNTKRNIFNRYREKFELYGINYQKYDYDTEPSNWIMGIRLNGRKYIDIKEHFDLNYMETRPMFYPMSVHTPEISVYSNSDDEIIAKLLSDECFMIPSYVELTEGEHNRIIEVIRRA